MVPREQPGTNTHTHTYKTHTKNSHTHTNQPQKNTPPITIGEVRSNYATLRAPVRFVMCVTCEIYNIENWATTTTANSARARKAAGHRCAVVDTATELIATLSKYAGPSSPPSTAQ